MPVVSTMVDYNNIITCLVFSDQLTRSRGHEFRHRIRCMKLQELGYNVFTVDDKQICSTNFQGADCSERV